MADRDLLIRTADELERVDQLRAPAQLEVPIKTSIEAMLWEAATNQSIDVEKMRAALELALRIDAIKAEREYGIAFSAAQEEMLPIVRDAQNDHTKSKYARLETIDEKIRPIYTKHGFSMSFNEPEQCPNGEVLIVCTVRHAAGHSEPYRLQGGLDIAGSQGKPNKTPIQAKGSTIAYLRRYLKLMVWDLALKNEDKDGNDTRLLTDEQWAKTNDMISVLSGAEVNAFLSYMGLSDLREMRAVDYEKAIVALSAKLRDKQRNKAAK